MAESQSTEEVELDEDGIVIQKVKCRILVVLPPEGFGDQILRYLRSSIHNIHCGSWVVSSRYEEPVKGRLQDEILVDGLLADASMDDFAGLVVAGCEGHNPLIDDPKVRELILAANEAEKLICGWGNAVEAFAAAHILNCREVTCPETSAEVVRMAGAKIVSREVVVWRNLVTGRDEASGMRLGQAVVEHIRISESEKALRAQAEEAQRGSTRRALLIAAGLVIGLAVLAKVTAHLFASLYAS